MLIELAMFLAASIFFLPLMIVGLLILSFCAERSHPISAVFVSLILGALVLAKYPLLAAEISDSPWLILVAILPYLAMGAAWALFKWTMKVRRIRETFLRVKADYLREHKLAENYFTRGHDRSDSKNANHPANLAVLVLTELYVRSSRRHRMSPSESTKTLLHDLRLQGDKISGKLQAEFEIDELIPHIKPQITNSKAEVSLWIAYWPASMLWFAILDFLAEAVEAVFMQMRAKMQRISDRAFADLA